MSSGSESDEEYVPGEPEQVSEEDSADEETDQQYQKELEHKTKKRQSAGTAKGIKRRKTRNTVPDEEVEKKVEEKVPETDVDPEENKKREDDLWAMFLDGTDTKPKPKETTTQAQKVVENNPTANDKGTKVEAKQTKDTEKERERRIFEFAGETIVVENNVIKEKIKTAESPAVAPILGGPSQGRKPGGLSSVLGQLNKKNKLSTLEKTKLDWVTYKKEEGIEEEIESHNKGKSGYLDRQDFLERTDHRQFEIERDLRMSRRSNR